MQLSIDETKPPQWHFETAQRLQPLRDEDVLVIGSGAGFAPLVDYETSGRDALLSAPTPEHFLPLVYTMGLHRPGEPVTFPVEGFDGGSVSMLSVRFG